MKAKRKVLGAMFKELESAPYIYQPSEHWLKLNAIHTKQILNGLNNFKRSVNLKYFNWGALGILAHQLTPLVDQIVKGKNFSPIFKSSFVSYKSPIGNIKSFDPTSALLYKIYVAALFDYVACGDTLKILDNLEEPSAGNPFIINYRGNSISQDLANSVHEFYSSTQELALDQPLDIADIGAGYGRLAYVFLKTLPKTTYTIIDIPPALYISQEYLLNISPKEKIFFFRPFKSYQEVKKEFEECRIRFIMAHQIEHLPDKSFDLIVNVSTLHEMRWEQIKNFIGQSNRLGRGYFYNKQFRRSIYKDSSFIGKDEYPIPKSWKTIYQHRHPIQRMFFEALYKVN